MEPLKININGLDLLGNIGIALARIGIVMNHLTYINALKNTTSNLPGVLDDWPRIDETLQYHYTDAILEMLDGLDEAIYTVPVLLLPSMILAIEPFINLVLKNSQRIYDIMGIDTPGGLGAWCY
jgi:hypothetical protein